MAQSHVPTVLGSGNPRRSVREISKECVRIFLACQIVITTGSGEWPAVWGPSKNVVSVRDIHIVEEISQHAEHCLEYLS